MELPTENLGFPGGSGVTSEPGHSPSGSDVAPLHLPQSGITKALPIKAFADGFLGGMVGGIAYNYAPAWLQFRELPFTTATILVLATILGVFEVWRVAQRRSPVLVRARMLVVLVACLAVLLTIAALSSTSQETLAPLPVEPHMIFLC